MTFDFHLWSKICGEMLFNNHIFNSPINGIKGFHKTKKNICVVRGWVLAPRHGRSALPWCASVASVLSGGAKICLSAVLLIFVC